jgi:hypothetical protein
MARLQCCCFLLPFRAGFFYASFVSWKSSPVPDAYSQDKMLKQLRSSSWLQLFPPQICCTLKARKAISTG